MVMMLKFSCTFQSKGYKWLLAWETSQTILKGIIQFYGFISMTNMKISVKWKQIMTLLVHAVSKPQFFKVKPQMDSTTYLELYHFNQTSRNSNLENREGLLLITTFSLSVRMVHQLTMRVIMQLSTVKGVVMIRVASVLVLKIFLVTSCTKLPNLFLL